MAVFAYPSKISAILVVYIEGGSYMNKVNFEDIGELLIQSIAVSAIITILFGYLVRKLLYVAPFRLMTIGIGIVITLIGMLFFTTMFVLLKK